MICDSARCWVEKAALFLWIDPARASLGGRGVWKQDKRMSDILMIHTENHPKKSDKIQNV